MGLESTDTIHGLVSSNPDPLDGKAQGDDHIRLLKNVLKRTFPGVDGGLFRFQIMTSDYTIQATDNWKFLAVPTGNPTITLPSATLPEFRNFVMVIGGGSPLTIVPAAGESINGRNPFPMDTRDRLLLISQGTSNGWTGIYTMDPTNTRTRDQYLAKPRVAAVRESILSNGAVAGAISVDANEIGFLVWTLTDNVTLAISGAVPGLAHALTFILTQDSVGNRQVTWPGSVKWPGTIPPILSGPGKVDVVTLLTWDGGASYLGFVGGQNF